MEFGAEEMSSYRFVREEGEEKETIQSERKRKVSSNQGCGEAQDLKQHEPNSAHSLLFPRTRE